MSIRRRQQPELTAQHSCKSRSGFWTYWRSCVRHLFWPSMIHTSNFLLAISCRSNRHETQPSPHQCLLDDPAALCRSTPKSHTYRFTPSGRISGTAYSPAESSWLRVKRYTSFATSHLCIEMELRSSEISCPNRLRIDSICRLPPFTVSRINSISGPFSPGRLLFLIVDTASGSGAGSRR